VEYSEILELCHGKSLVFVAINCGSTIPTYVHRLEGGRMFVFLDLTMDYRPPISAENRQNDSSVWGRKRFCWQLTPGDYSEYTECREFLRSLCKMSLTPGGPQWIVQDAHAPAHVFPSLVAEFGPGLLGRGIITTSPQTIVLRKPNGDFSHPGLAPLAEIAHMMTGESFKQHVADRCKMLLEAPEKLVAIYGADGGLGACLRDIGQVAGTPLDPAEIATILADPVTLQGTVATLKLILCE